MIWSLDLDDFNGVFCGQGKYPLLTKIKKTFEKIRKLKGSHKKTPKLLKNTGINRYLDRFFLLCVYLNIISLFL